METSYQKYTRDVFVYGAVSVLTSLGAALLVPLITKTLGAHDYGIWAQVQATISLAIGFAGLGLPFALSRFLAGETDRKAMADGFYSSAIAAALFGLAISAALVALAGPVARVFFAGATQIVRITGLIILFWSLDLMFLSFFRARSQMKRYGIFTAAVTYGEIVLIAFFVLTGHTITSAVLVVLLVTAAILPVLFLYVRSQIGLRWPDFSRLKEYVSFGLPTIIGNMANWAVTLSDRYVIQYYLGAAAVGTYSAAYSLAIVPGLLAGIIGFVLPATLSRLYDGRKMDEVKNILSYSLKYFLAVAIPFVFGAAVIGQPVLQLFSTAQIATEGHFIVPIVAMGNLLSGAYLGIIDLALILARKTRPLAFVWIVAAVVNLGLNIALVPHWGILGAAVTSLFSYALALGLGSYLCFKEFAFPIDWRFIVKSIVAATIMALVLLFLPLNGPLATLLGVAAGTALYGVLLFLLRGFKRAEVSFLLGLFRQHAAE